jgi:hypothetical protein
MATLWRPCADLSAKDFDRGGGASHHHGFRVEAALVQRGAPIIEPRKDIDLATGGAGALVVELT